MDIAEYLAVIDRLRAREFPAERGRSDLVVGGPRYFLAELEASHGLRLDCAERRAGAADDFHALKEALSQALDARMGERQEPWGMLTLRVRRARGEAIPEPWSDLSLRTDELNLWGPDETGRWLAVGVADRDRADEIQLLAVVTDMDPP
ncbi:hypothetical protein [Streptomyces naganishii]|uniref:Uncharacterized protein n=1 Tax=Streptomyces naganishii JCM 4654 TaxID=1306179 RepID=A0A919CU17_9ACTN|nr:hypothetical protein [Streptomyces naganishii]GHD86530.1 hypothetical protein GCM10010508_14990 [Streptomyces naganishii JCM 4654]